MEKIKDYLENKTVRNTLDILNEEIVIINKKLEQLKSSKVNNQCTYKIS